MTLEIFAISGLAGYRHKPPDWESTACIPPCVHQAASSISASEHRQGFGRLRFLYLAGLASGVESVMLGQRRDGDDRSGVDGV